MPDPEHRRHQGSAASPPDGEDDRPFWQRKTLAEMTGPEWESLCDGCARCCAIKLEDADTGEVVTTNVVCRLLDLDACRCTHYPRSTSPGPGLRSSRCRSRAPIRLAAVVVRVPPDSGRARSGLVAPAGVRRSANGCRSGRQRAWQRGLRARDPSARCGRAIRSALGRRRPRPGTLNVSAYGIAWCAVVLAGGLLGVLAFRALRGWRSLRYLATALVFVCAVTPYGFDAEHTAPAFLVAAFRLPFVDATADPTGAVMALGCGQRRCTAGVSGGRVVALVGCQRNAGTPRQKKR